MTPDPALTFAQEALGCREHAGYNTCIEHGGPTWPCPEATRLAALIEARDAQIRADECEQAAALVSSSLMATLGRRTSMAWPDGSARSVSSSPSGGRPRMSDDTVNFSLVASDGR